jgi:hypothetical protein
MVDSIFIIIKKKNFFFLNNKRIFCVFWHYVFDSFEINNDIT